MKVCLLRVKTSHGNELILNTYTTKHGVAYNI